MCVEIVMEIAMMRVIMIMIIIIMLLSILMMILMLHDFSGRRAGRRHVAHFWRGAGEAAATCGTYFFSHNAKKT